MHYSYLTPALLALHQRLEGIILDKLATDSSLMSRLTIMVVAFLLLYYIYLAFYPLKRMEKEIFYSSGMIALIPKDLALND